MSTETETPTAAERQAIVAGTIVDYWPHRMSNAAAATIDNLYLAWLPADATSPPSTRAAVLQSMQAEVREVNEANGWFESDRTVGDDLALLHSEVSEALDAYRDHGLDDPTGQCPEDFNGRHLHGASPCKPEGFGSELADVLVRLLDTCERRGVDLAAEYERKVAFNRTRGHRHGGKNL